MVRILLRLLVQMFIRHGHGFSEVMEALRAEFIDVSGLVEDPVMIMGEKVVE